MDRRNPNLPMIWVAVGTAACLVGIWMSVATLRQTPTRIGHLRDKMGQLQELAELERQAGGGGARDVLERLASPYLPSVSTVAGTLLPDAELSIVEEDPASAGGGWMVRTVRLSGEQVPLAKFMGMVAALESERPPWRVQASTLVAVGSAPGTARIEVTLTGLHKEDL